MEMRVLTLAFGDDELGKAEIAERLGISVAEAGTLLRTALSKLKQAAHPECELLASRTSFTTLSMERPMLRPGICTRYSFVAGVILHPIRTLFLSGPRGFLPVFFGTLTCSVCAI